ncbi:MAG: CPBP family intramembrane metalloprotease [Phycisphaerales bacterium]|nr:CPBP family intramembrane metalloprotease [Phycisphaerales bacterium]
MKTSVGSQWMRCVIAAVVGLGVFFLLGALLTLISPRVGIEGVVARQVAFKGLMIAVAMLAWLAMRRPWGEMGWRRIAWPRGGWKWVLMACLAMAVTAMAMILTRHRHPVLTEFSFLQVVLVIWVLSSVSEEIYVRGWVQSWCQAVEEAGSGVLTPSIVTSALLFASMHVSLMWMGAGVLGGGIIVCATLLVGWACAVLRARTGSLWAPIALHILANMAGVPGGILGVVIYRVVYGELPALK